MTLSVRTLQGSKIKSFKGSSSLCPRGSNSRGFSNNACELNSQAKVNINFQATLRRSGRLHDFSVVIDFACKDTKKIENMKQNYLKLPTCLHKITRFALK